jgi:hypothetical protein
MSPGGRVLVGLGLAGAAACATGTWLAPTGLDDYPAARVRVYYTAAGQCRLEVVTPTETIQTQPTRCARVPHRVTP